MPLLSKELLTNLGITLADADYELLADHFETTLNERVINEIVLELDESQAAELARLQDADDTTIMTWLQTNVPDVADIVSDEIDILLGEIADNSEAIAAANA